jgi:adenylate cyclase
MISSNNAEFVFLRYVPNMLSDKYVSIAAVVIDFNNLEEGVCTMSVAEDWQTQVRLLDPESDLEMAEALLTDIRRRLSSKDERPAMIRQMEDSFSNVVQVSSRQKCPVAATPRSIEALARGLWKAPSRHESSLRSCGQ